MEEENVKQEEENKPEGEKQGGEEQQKEESKASKAMEGEEEKINGIALLSYISILFLVPLLAAREDEFAQYHAKQGFTLFIISAIGMFVGVIPILGWIIAPLIGIFSLILAIIGLINVFKGEKKELPIIGQYAKKFDI